MLGGVSVLMCLSTIWLQAHAMAGGLPRTVSCSFDENLCTFVQDQQDDLDWTRQAGKTPTYATGPDCDPVHCQTGRYLFIESSSPASNGDRAKLRTPTLGGHGQRCLTFYYHMYGNHIGSLTVTQTNVLSEHRTVLWADSGNKGRRWFTVSRDFTASEAYDISFEATAGVYRGDIAIDSISVTEGPCTACMRFNCSFEHDFCGWTNARDPADTLDWTRWSGDTDTPGTGPAADRLNPNGYYLYVESSRTQPGDLARLVSPEVSSTPNGQHCLSFWYHVYGTTSGNLTVIYQTEEGREESLWQVSGDQGNVWHSQHVNVTHRARYSFYLVFEATLSGFWGDLAIDDVSLRNSLCGD